VGTILDSRSFGMTRFPADLFCSIRGKMRNRIESSLEQEKLLLRCCTVRALYIAATVIVSVIAGCSIDAMHPRGLLALPDRAFRDLIRVNRHSSQWSVGAFGLVGNQESVQNS
jgi:hypothetical protein